MATWANEALDRIRAAYAEATRMQPRRRRQSLPEWDNLEPGLRDAFLVIYMLGRKDAEIKAHGDRCEMLARSAHRREVEAREAKKTKRVKRKTSGSKAPRRKGR